MHQVVTVCDRVIALVNTNSTLRQIIPSKEGIRKMTRQTNVLDCQQDVLLLALPHIENKLAQDSLQEFYGRQKVPMDPAATLSEHHALFTNDGYVTHDCFIFVNSFGARYLLTAKDENPTPRICRHDYHTSFRHAPRREASSSPRQEGACPTLS